MNRPMRNIDDLLVKRITGDISEEEYKYLLGALGLFSLRQLSSVLKEGPLDRLREEAQKEMRIREKPIHWTVYATLVVTIIAMVFAGIGAWPTVQGWIFSAKSPTLQSTEIASSPPETERKSSKDSVHSSSNSPTPMRQVYNPRNLASRFSIYSCAFMCRMG